MAVKVKILPSGHEFVSEGKSNLLEAGLRSGLALGYGCSNGNCGECLAKVVSGEVELVQHHDYRICAEDRATGHVLMCSNAAATDVVIQAPEANSSNEIPQQQLTAKVRAINFVNDDVALVHLKTPRTNRLRFLAGQRVQLGGNNMPKASLPVGSCPCDDMNLHFQIPLVSGDDFSEHIFKQLKKGDSVNVVGPQGDFVLEEDSTRPLVFIAWQTGFAPVRSLVEHAMALDVAETIHLAWIAQNANDRYMDNLCRSWNDALDNFSYVPIDTSLRDNAAGAGFDSGSIIGQLNIEAGDLPGYDFYIAGNSSLLASCREILSDNGVPANQIKLD